LLPENSAKISQRATVMKKLAFCFLLMVVVFGHSLLAQTKKLRWEWEECEYEGTYDSKKYTAEQIRNTLKLMNGYFRLDTSFNATVFKYEDIAARDFTPIEAEYQRKSGELKSLKIVNLPYWEKRRGQQLAEMENYYWLSKTTMASYKTPQSLRQYPYADSCKTKYAEPLIAGGETLLKTWEALNIESRKKNGDPARVKRTFEEQRASPDALKFALVEVTTFGWWNCANQFVDQGDDHGILEKNFRKIFTRVRTIRCEEP
jgi:hypothetical protein